MRQCCTIRHMGVLDSESEKDLLLCGLVTSEGREARLRLDLVLKVVEVIEVVFNCLIKQTHLS